MYTPPMAKYDPFRNHLSLSGQPRLAMTFDQIAALVSPQTRSMSRLRYWGMLPICQIEINPNAPAIAAFSRSPERWAIVA